MSEAQERIKGQAGPCGIICVSCPLGNGAVAESASRTRKNIADYKIAMWSPFVPGGEAIDWAAVDRGLDWLEKYAVCAGCGNGGGPPDCTIRICAREKGIDLCSSCPDLEGCTRFEWLQEHGSQLKEMLMEGRGLSRDEYIQKMSKKMPWQA